MLLKAPQAWYMLYLHYAPLEREPILVAVMAYNELRTKVTWLFRKEWEDLLCSDDKEVLDGTDDHFTKLLPEMGTTAFIQLVEDTLSHALRAEGPRLIENASVLEGGNREEIREFLAGILETLTGTVQKGGVSQRVDDLRP
jgi:hypothetical protein